jgi:hypothetical protein
VVERGGKKSGFGLLLNLKSVGFEDEDEDENET